MFKLEFKFVNYYAALTFAENLQNECRQRGSISVERVLKIASGVGPSLKSRFFTYPDIKDYTKKYGWVYSKGGLDVITHTELTQHGIHVNECYVVRMYNDPIELTDQIQEQIDKLYKAAIKMLVVWDHKDPDMFGKALVNLKEIQRLLDSDTKTATPGSLGDVIYNVWKENKK
jgi:hypothetical protein